jgi:hypothetical protein
MPTITVEKSVTIDRPAEGVWQLPWSTEDGASTVLPGAGGIHRVGNPGAETAISVHLYGPRLGEVDGHDYDPSRDHVRDRVDA